MSSCVKKYPTKEFSTPPRTLKSAPCSPMPPTEKKISSPTVRADSFHVIHKVPAGDSPYVKAKHVQLIDKDPSKAVSLFWSSINSGDRVDSSLKDMAIVMKQLNRADEAIEAIKSFRHLCPLQTQESLDNILIDLYKRCGRFEEQIQMLQHKLKLVEEGMAFGGKRTKIARSQGRKLYVTIDQERSRLLGNLAWAYMQQNNFQTAEEMYRKALSIEPDKNKHCNLAVCLMQRGELEEAKSLLQEIKPSTKDREVGDSYIKSFDRACEILAELESQLILSPVKRTEEKDAHGSLATNKKSSQSLTSFINEDQNQGFDFLGCRKWEDENSQEFMYLEVNSNGPLEKQKKISCSRNLFNNEARISSLEKRRWADEPDFEEISPQNRRNTNGTPQYVSFQPRTGQQSYERPLYVDKWNKQVNSPRGLERKYGLSSSKKGRCTSETGIEEGLANNGTDNSVNVFNLTVSEHGNLKPKGTGAICSRSQYSTGGGWKRSCGADNCCAVTESSSNTKLVYSICQHTKASHKTGHHKTVDQSYERSLYVDKWNKQVNSPRGPERKYGLSSSKKGRCTSETGIEEGSANNGTDNNVNVFNLTVSEHGNLKPKGTGAICSRSQYSTGGGWKRSCGADNCCAVTKSSSNTKLLIEQSIPIENTHATPPQQLAFNSGDEDHRSETTVLRVEGKNVGRNNDYEADNLSVHMTGNPKPTRAFSGFRSVKSWADMVEEEEAEEAFSTSKMDFMTNRETNLSQDSSVSFQTPTKWINECNYGESFHDENLNSNIITDIPPSPVTSTRPLLQLPPQTPPSPQYCIENLRQKLQAVDLKEGYTKSKGEVRNPMFQRKWDSANYYSSASPKKALAFNDHNFAQARGSGSAFWSITKANWRQNRLQVFRNITPDSPRT